MPEQAVVQEVADIELGGLLREAQHLGTCLRDDAVVAEQDRLAGRHTVGEQGPVAGQGAHIALAFITACALLATTSAIRR